MAKDLIKPPKIFFGDTIGIFTSSYPANIYLKEKYNIGKQNLKNAQFNILEGDLTKSNKSKFEHVLGTPMERAEELNKLFADKKVKLIMSNIGGYCSGSILPYLDIDLISRNPKFLIGYSDTSVIHAFLQVKCNMVSIYGPSVTASFGEILNYPTYTEQSFFNQIGLKEIALPYRWSHPTKYTNTFVDAKKSGWEKVKKKYHSNKGWFVLNEGSVSAKIFISNQNSLLTLAGTDYFPNLNGKILVLEQMNTSLSLEERQLNQLMNMGIFRKIKGLIVSKPEKVEGKNFDKYYNEMLIDFVKPERNTPVISNFDTGHTHPMLTLPQSVLFGLNANNSTVEFVQKEFAYS